MTSVVTSQLVFLEYNSIFSRPSDANPGTALPRSGASWVIHSLEDPDFIYLICLKVIEAKKPT